jgi:hypothetical protein
MQVMPYIYNRKFSMGNPTQFFGNKSSKKSGVLRFYKRKTDNAPYVVNYKTKYVRDSLSCQPQCEFLEIAPKETQGRQSDIFFALLFTDEFLCSHQIQKIVGLTSSTVELFIQDWKNEGTLYMISCWDERDRVIRYKIISLAHSKKQITKYAKKQRQSIADGHFWWEKRAKNKSATK